MNQVLLMGRLTRDPEIRALASGKLITNFSLATNAYVNGEERAEYHNVVAWDRLAETIARFCVKGQQILVDGRLQTRSWDDERGQRHWRTEVIAAHVELLGSRITRPLALPNPDPLRPVIESELLGAEGAEAIA